MDSPHAIARGVALALCMLLAACDRGPADPSAAASEAAALMAAGGRDSAAAILRDGLGRWPDDATLRELQGDLDLAGGQPHLAEAAYRRALSASGGGRPLAVKLARSVLAQGRRDDARALAVAQPGDAPGIRAGLGLVALEAELGDPVASQAGLQEQARSLWLLAATGTGDAALVAAADRLRELAGAYPAVEAGRQHATCRVEAGAAGPRAAPPADAPVVRVGPGQRFRRPSEAAAAAPDGALVLIAPGDYPGDVAVWHQDGLTLRGDGGRVRLASGGRAAEDRGIWVIRGDRTVVENVEFSGARSAGRNGAGIFLLGRDLVVRDSLFHHNQMGILTSNETPESEILISHSEFRDNTSGAVEGQLGHNIYIGRAGSFTLEFSYVHGAAHGHNVKSRARANRILYNRIVDGRGGRSSYLLDLPEGGQADIIGNEFQKGDLAENHPFIAFGEESRRGLHPGSAVRVAHNSFYNVYLGAVALRLAVDAPAMMINNLFAGAPVASIVGNAATDRNTFLKEGGIVDGAALDFSLTPDSPAVDAGEERTAAGAPVPVAEFEYVHPLRQRPRPRAWRPDAGAHEFCRQRADAA